MNTINKKLSEITPYEKNAKKHDKTQIANVAESIRKYGFVQPLVIDRDGVIVIGHCRYLAAKKLKMIEVPCVCVDELTPEQVKALRIIDNKSNESEWDLDMLAIDLDGLDLDGFDFDFGLPEEEEDVVEDEAPEVDKTGEPFSQLGDVWQCGRHRLCVGDSTVPEDVSKLMGGELADMLITDPPYNVDYTGGTKDKLKISNDNMGDAQFREFLKNAFSAANDVMRPGAVFYIWHADSEGFNFRGACKDIGWKVRQCLIWAKNSIVMGRQDYQWKHEPCLYGWKSGASHSWYSDRKQSTILNFDKPVKSELHPTMKPVGLFDYQIKNSSQPGDKVLDLFGGSGTTMIACEQDGRDAYIMELDPRYADVNIKRWEALTGKKAELISSNEEFVSLIMLFLYYGNGKIVNSENGGD